MIDYQFYPTPPELAERAWNLFKNREFTGILEPSAGHGDLIFGCRAQYHKEIVDCIELAPENIAVLRSKGLRVVDTDFLSFETSKRYSHCIMNSPFANGVNHVLKAWSILKNAELVAIVNAATIENPNDESKQYLVELIEQFGSVEFIDSAFMTEDSKRKTEVRVALIYLKKTTTGDNLFNLDDFELTREGHRDEPINPEANALAIPNSTIKNSVIAFNRAARATYLSIEAEKQAAYYRNMIGAPAHLRKPEETAITKPYNKQYDDMKRDAWSYIINATEFKEKFSRKVIAKLEEDLDEIRLMEFTEKNIYGLLEGLSLNKGELDNQMLFDIFDTISLYHEGNRFIYRSHVRNGWKSNSKHRSCAFRIKHTRFILPAHNRCLGTQLFGYEGKLMLADFDKAFALLDGKWAPDTSLVSLFENTEESSNYTRLCEGERLEASYLSCRYYPGTDSIHFFPTKKGKKLIDRLNRLVGRLRNWLPEEGASPEFWEQYDKAPAVTKVLEDEYDKGFSWNFEGKPFDEFHMEVCEKLGVTVFNQLESATEAPKISNAA